MTFFFFEKYSWLQSLWRRTLSVCNWKNWSCSGMHNIKGSGVFAHCALRLSTYFMSLCNLMRLHVTRLCHDFLNNSLSTAIPSIPLHRSKQKSSDSHKLHAKHRFLCTANERTACRGDCHSEATFWYIATSTSHTCASRGGIHRGGSVQIWGHSVRGGPVVGDPSRED